MGSGGKGGGGRRRGWREQEVGGNGAVRDMEVEGSREAGESKEVGGSSRNHEDPASEGSQPDPASALTLNDGEGYLQFLLEILVVVVVVVIVVVVVVVVVDILIELFA